MATFTVKEKARGMTVKRAADICRDFKKLAQADQQSLWVMGFDISKTEIMRECVHKGGIMELHLDPKLLFRRALLSGAAAWACVYSHTGRNPYPSLETISAVRGLFSCSKTLKLEMMDFIIVAEGDYFSFNEAGFFKLFTDEDGTEGPEAYSRLGEAEAGTGNIINLRDYRRELS